MRAACKTAPALDTMWGKRHLPLLVLLSLTGGCAESGYMSRAYSVQGKYGHLTCEQLAATHKTLSTDIDKFARLTDKAAQESAGAVIGAAVYGPSLAQKRADRRLVEETEAEKQCEPKR